MKIGLLAGVLALVCAVAPAKTQDRAIRVADGVKVERVSEHVYVHVSVSDIAGYGKVASNGVVFVYNGQALLFDTPCTNIQTEQLVNWLADSLDAEVIGFVPNHWHEDCMGGLEYLQHRKVRSYAHIKTIGMAQEKGLPVPENAFAEVQKLGLGNKSVECYYLGAGHTADNIVVWIPSDQVLFAGCMVKSVASKNLGNLADTCLAEWPATLERVDDKFRTAKIVVPGHGAWGGRELIAHTQKLLLKAASKKKR